MRPILDNGPGSLPASLYVHLPFCRERCLYCSFVTVANDPSAHAPLIEAVLAEARRHAASGSPMGHLETVYLGGGTPGLIPAALLDRLLTGLFALWTCKTDVEITLEANPTNVTERSLADWRALGVTRLSVGVQTFRDDVLSRLGRRHDAETARRALRDIAARWQHTWSADLLAGWAGQDLPELEADLGHLIGAAPPHISVYALTVEPGTPLAALQRAGRHVTSSAGLAPALDLRCATRLAAAGYERYEVSNFALPGHRSRHNQVYWADRSYLGLGPGAASSIHPYRWLTRSGLAEYLDAAHSGRPLRTSAELIAPEARLTEVLGVGLRTRDGLTSRMLDGRFGGGATETLLHAGERLLGADLLRFEAGRLFVPPESLSRADAIVAELIALVNPEAFEPIGVGG